MVRPIWSPVYLTHSFAEYLRKPSESWDIYGISDLNYQPLKRGDSRISFDRYGVFTKTNMKS
jgi:hypothetical protein